jgi:hypothetical protein
MESAEMAKKTGKLRGSEMVEGLKHLPQAAAAWLLGVAPRTLRDMPDAPRSPDRTYDARALVRWYLASPDRGPRPEIDEDDLERLLLIAEQTATGPPSDCHIVAIVDTLRKLSETYGAGFGAVLLDVLLRTWGETADVYRGETDPRASEAEIRRAVDREVRARVEQQARDQLEIIVQCEQCRKFRRGRRWTKGNPHPSYEVTFTLCPSCEGRQKRTK